MKTPKSPRRDRKCAPYESLAWTLGWRLGRIWCGYTPMLSGTGGGWLQLGLCLRIVSKEFGWSWDIMGTQCFFPILNKCGRSTDLGINDSSQGVQTHRTFKVGELPSGTFDIGMEIRGWFPRKRIYIYLQILGFPHIWHHHLLQSQSIDHGSSKLTFLLFLFPLICPWDDFPAIFDSRRVGRSKARQVHGLLSAFETLGGRKQADRGWMEFLGRLLDLDICIL